MSTEIFDVDKEMKFYCFTSESKYYTTSGAAKSKRDYEKLLTSIRIKKTKLNEQVK